MAILCSVCVTDDKFRAAVLLGDRGAPVKDFGKAADAVPVIGAVLGLAFKAVILDMAAPWVPPGTMKTG